MRISDWSSDVCSSDLFVTDYAETMGCSPDGLVGDDGMVEVKCLKAENHIKAILYHASKGHCPPDYVQQTQGQLLICERQWCDLVFYHPDLPLLAIRQEPVNRVRRSEEHTSELQSLMRISYAVF